MFGFDLLLGTRIPLTFLQFLKTRFSNACITTHSAQSNLLVLWWKIPNLSILAAITTTGHGNYQQSSSLAFSAKVSFDVIGSLHLSRKTSKTEMLTTVMFRVKSKQHKSQSQFNIFFLVSYLHSVRN